MSEIDIQMLIHTIFVHAISAAACGVSGAYLFLSLYE